MSDRLTWKILRTTEAYQRLYVNKPTLDKLNFPVDGFIKSLEGVYQVFVMPHESTHDVYTIYFMPDPLDMKWENTFQFCLERLLGPSGE